MSKLFYHITKSNLIKDNLVLFMGNSLGAFFTFLFHFYMGRKLGPEDYGALGAILALIYLFTIPLTTIQTSIAKFTAIFKSERKYKEIHYLHKASTRKLLIFGIISTFIFLSLSGLIANYLHISLTPLLILSLYITFSFLLYINRGLLQGLQKFNKFSKNLVFEGLIKLVFGITLIFFGFKLNGAVGAIVFALISAFLISVYQLRDIIKHKIKKFNSNVIYRYTIPVLIALMMLTAFYSLDLLLVKHFFVDERAGYYAAVSLLGKVVFFGSMPITQVMFPKVNELYHRKKKSKNILYKSGLMVLAFSLPIIAIYFLFSRSIIKLLYGELYLEASNLLGWFAVIMTLFSLIYLISFYNLSINKKNFLYILGLFNILEIILIYIFHETLIQVVSILTILMLVLALIMFLKTVLIKDGKTKYNNSSL
ncbi:MAG: Polysaccharide biosynthesis protein [archaeon GW2011_AR20]|nr:MAG: Polysaccharide biosynthesis protein [archaeon GW2011_AR20]MBS3160466.1 oligosaccharide flippase family protein [Candidatus Woesearchaeota archaeon]